MRSSPEAKPPIEPSEATTRWHGTISEIGLLPTAPPTARAAPGLPTAAAISPYERVEPVGIARSCSQTRCWKGVPRGASGSAHGSSNAPGAPPK